MLERHLRIRLAPIAARARILDLWKNLGWSWGGFFSSCCLALVTSTWGRHVLYAAGSCAHGWGWWYGPFIFRFTRFSLNYKEIAWRLVEKHPEVRSLVMTAVEQSLTKLAVN